MSESARVVQLVERKIVHLKAVGSIPISVNRSPSPGRRGVVDA